MIVLFLILFFLCLWGLRITKENQDYISLQGTAPVKGIFAVIILCSHMGSYLSLDATLANDFYHRIMVYLGQAMVAPYFFYSGYGILLSYKKKAGYLSGFMKNRLLKTLFHFDFAILLFIIVQSLLSIYYPARNYLWCWIGWESVGNSNWFVFVILSLYLLAFVGMLLDKKTMDDGRVLVITTFFFSVFLWVFLRLCAHKDFWWVDTIAAFTLGMLFALGRHKVETMLRGSHVRWLIAFVCVLALYIAWHHGFGVDIFGICSCLFCVLLVLTTMKVKVGNPVLIFLGRNAFAIYILQRLPMLLLANYGLNLRPAFFIPLSILIIIPLAEAFTRFTDRIDRQLFHV